MHMGDDTLFEQDVKEAFRRIAASIAGRELKVCASASMLHAAANAGVAGISREVFLRNAAAQYDRVVRILETSQPRTKATDAAA